MTSLFESNKLSLKKLFCLHEKEGFLKFTDLLKICSSTRIFPDLLTSTDLHKILIEVARDPETQTIAQNLTFSQFELFLKQTACRAFPNKPAQDQEGLLFAHLKTSCPSRYSVDFDITFIEKKGIKKVPKLIISPTEPGKETKAKKRSIYSDHSISNLKSASMLLKVSPGKQTSEARHKAHASSIITPRIRLEKNSAKKIIKPLLTERADRSQHLQSSLSSSSVRQPAIGKLERLSMIISQFKKRDIQKEVKTVKSKNFLRVLSLFERKARQVTIQKKLSFKIWAIVTRKYKKNNEN